MSGQRKTIFVSSVQKEFQGERRAIKDFVRNDPLLRRFFNVFLFEDLPAQDRRPDDAYLAEISRSDIYVGLFGNEYGFEDSAGLSPTEREFDEATDRGKPRLIFVKAGEDKARHPKMLKLINKAGGQLIRRRFASPPDLTAALYAALVEYLERSGDLRTVPFDASACDRASLDDLSFEKIKAFLAAAKRERNYPLPPNTGRDKALAHLSLLDNGRPTNAAVLLFGKEPQRFLLTSEVKCLHFHGTTVEKPIPSYQIYKGTVFELVDHSLDFVLSKISRRIGTRAQSVQAPDGIRTAAGSRAGGHRQCRGPSGLHQQRQRPGHAFCRPSGGLEPRRTSAAAHARSPPAATPVHSPQSAHRRTALSCQIHREGRQRHIGHDREVQNRRFAGAGLRAAGGPVGGDLMAGLADKGSAPWPWLE